MHGRQRGDDPIRLSLLVNEEVSKLPHANLPFDQVWQQLSVNEKMNSDVAPVLILTSNIKEIGIKQDFCA